MSKETRREIPITDDDSPAPVSGAQTAEPSPEAAAMPAAEAPVETPEARLAEVQAELEKFRDRALRGQADFENFRKRAAREKEEAVRYANTDLLERLIPILDNFELGLSAARGTAEGGPILQGMEMVAKQLAGFLGQFGVEAIDATGKKFDPNLHEAVAQEASGEVAEGHVVRQLRGGFKLKDRLIRPSMVVVSKGAGE